MQIAARHRRKQDSKLPNLGSTCVRHGPNFGRKAARADRVLGDVMWFMYRILLVGAFRASTRDEAFMLCMTYVG